MEIDIILSPKQAQSFRDRINADGTDARAIDDALAHVKSENAEASVQVDLDAIRTLIQKYSGGFGTLNDTVQQYLRRWFVSQGGVKVVARRSKRLFGTPSTPARNREQTISREAMINAVDSIEGATAIATTSPIAKAARLVLIPEQSNIVASQTSNPGDTDRPGGGLHQETVV